MLGIGNLVMTDDGIGVQVVQSLAKSYRFPPEVIIFDGGTLGLDLLPQMEGVERLLVVDAIDNGSPPGTLIRLMGDEVPIALATKLSPHQMGLKDLLAVAELMGIRPPEIVLLGVQPADIELGMELSSTLSAKFDELVDNVLAELKGWGVTPEPL